MSSATNQRATSTWAGGAAVQVGPSTRVCREDGGWGVPPASPVRCQEEGEREPRREEERGWGRVRASVCMFVFPLSWSLSSPSSPPYRIRGAKRSQGLIGFSRQPQPLSSPDMRM
eukprot:764337-Hanusia_phi.AAC.2